MPESRQANRKYTAFAAQAEKENLREDPGKCPVCGVKGSLFKKVK